MIPQENLAEMTDKVFEALKEFVMEKGLTIGDFKIESNVV